jgi:ribosomal protein S18 acetylase RimI-like enzyme
MVTSAVLAELSGVETIGLNVRADNDAALHLYASLGFARHCRFLRGAREALRASSGRPLDQLGLPARRSY